MITTASDLAVSALTSTWVQTLRVESWYGDQQLADDIPVGQGMLEVDRTLNVPERVTLTIPRTDGLNDWSPTVARHPLSAYGQWLRVSVGIGITGSQTEFVQLGWFVIVNSNVEGDEVQVEAVGLLKLIEEAKFITPFQPASGETFGSTIRNICEPALPVSVSASLTDRAVPTTLTWDTERIGALNELLDAWPADAMVMPEGYLQINPVTTGSSVTSLTDGTGGSVVQWEAETTRDAAYNCAVCQGQAADGTQFQGVALDNDVNSPTYFGGQFNPLPVPFTLFSPLMTTVAQCRTAATTLLKKKKRVYGRTLSAQVVPNPLLQVGDAVTVTGAGLVGKLTEINGLTFPLTPGQGPMMLRLGVV